MFIYLNHWIYGTMQIVVLNRTSLSHRRDVMGKLQLRSWPRTRKQIFHRRAKSCGLYRNIQAITSVSFPVALQSLRDLSRLTYRRFLKLFRHMLGLLGRVISPSQGLYLHRTTQKRKTWTNIHALSGIQTHDPSNQPAKTHTSDCTAIVTGNSECWPF
jgi:hypothetical protein